MRIGEKYAHINNSITSYESGISWKSANKYRDGIDYGIETDHLSAKIFVIGITSEIIAFKNGIGAPSRFLSTEFDSGEKPFGPAFECGSYDEYRYLIMGKDDIITSEKDTAQMSFEIATLWEEPPWAYKAIPFNLSNFAVQEVKRESEEDKYVVQKEAGWAAFQHGWKRPEFSLSLLADSKIMGGTIRWLLSVNRTNPFAINCNDSMMLIDSQSESAVICISFGNLQRLGNSGLWQANFDLARAS